ncbi:MAG: hypothetical protein GY789_22065 [Hyphomicrobiales bacterium]|nr:hypothetical protein [Hyphomicrobiales bacterium]
MGGDLMCRPARPMAVKLFHQVDQHGFRVIFEIGTETVTADSWTGEEQSELFRRMRDIVLKFSKENVQFL